MGIEAPLARTLNASETGQVDEHTDSNHFGHGRALFSGPHGRVGRSVPASHHVSSWPIS